MVNAKHGINRNKEATTMIDETDTLLADAPPEYDNPEDLLDAVVKDYTDVPVARDYFPEEYTVYYTGPRGSSKTLQLARHALKGLAIGAKVFTNIELYPEKAEITNQANPVGLEFLLSFDESLQDAVIVISEIDTWFDRMRETSTGNRLGGKFMQQLRKKGLRIFFDTQDYLPGVLMRQVDKLVYCNDFFFSQWGRERNLPKGTTFYYDCYDYSGIFTGWRGYHWREVLYHAERVWPLFNTYQIYDPLQFARKIKVVGGDMEYDQDTKQLYAPGERTQRIRDNEEHEGRLFSTNLFNEWAATGFLQGLLDRNGITDDPTTDPAKGWLRISTSGARKCLNDLSGELREAAEEQYENLWAELRRGQLAQLVAGGKFIRLRRPFVAEEVNGG
jgi:hypothetical protein